LSHNDFQQLEGGWQVVAFCPEERYFLGVLPLPLVGWASEPGTTLRSHPDPPHLSRDST